MDSSQTFYQAQGASLHGDPKMLRSTVPVYEGDNFEVRNQWSFFRFERAWELGEIVRREMPAPSPKRPLKTKMVYFWAGETTVNDENRKSAEMPPLVTELAASGSRMHKAFAFSYRGIMMGNASRPVVVPA